MSQGKNCSELPPFLCPMDQGLGFTTGWGCSCLLPNDRRLYGEKRKRSCQVCPVYSQHSHHQNGVATVTSALVIRNGSMRGDSSSRPFWLCRFNNQGLAVRGWRAKVTVNEGNVRSGRQNAMACVFRKGITISVGC